MAELLCYDWDAEYERKQLDEFVKTFKKKEGYFDPQLDSLTNDQCKELGFGIWDEENPMRLIPLWLFPFLPETINRCTSITGETPGPVLRAEIDNDHRGGYIPFGIIPCDVSIIVPEAESKN